MNKSDLNQKVILASAILLFQLLTFSLIAQAQVVVTPVEYEDALRNPLKGFRNDLKSAGDSKYIYTAIVRDYIKWNEIENNANDGVQKLIDYADKNWGHLPALNVKVIPRVYIDWDSKSGNEFWPSDLKSGDWSSQEFKDRVVKLIEKMGEAWNDDPRIAWVQTGIIGYWGEQEKPVGVNEDGWAARLGEAFSNAFPDKKMVVRNQKYWDAEGYEWGVYWDSYAHPGQRNGAWKNIQETNAEGRYLTEVVEGEVAYNWGENSFDPLYGGEPELTLNNDDYTDNMIDVIRELHCTGLGWLAAYLEINSGLNVNLQSIAKNANRIQKEFGYRFLIPEYSCETYVEQGQNINVKFKAINEGSAPFYHDWPLYFTLIDEAGQKIVWKEEITDVDIRDWVPGNHYNYTSRKFQTPAPEFEVEASFTVPDYLPDGQYMTGISILEPNSKSPGIFFAVENFIAESQSQPLLRIGIGEALIGNPIIDPTIFDDPVEDDERFYTMEPVSENTFKLFSSALNGSITPGGVDFPKGEMVTIEASPDKGFIFKGWSGDISGDENPVSFLMDGHKNIVANFAPAISETVLALNCGGDDYTAVDGTNFVADNVTGNTHFANNPISGTEDDILYQTSRFGQTLNYALEIENGDYVVNLMFAEIYFSSPGKRIFDVTMENSLLADNLDIFVEVGMNKPYEIKKSVTISDGELNITMSASENNAKISAITVMRLTEATTYTITSNVTNGGLELDPVGGVYLADTEVSVTALPAWGYRFTDWNGDLSGEENPTTITIDGDKIISPVFELIPVYTLELIAGNNGIITKDAEGESFMEGTEIAVSAIPNEGYLFQGWSGDFSGDENPLIISIESDISLSANFIEIPRYTLTTSAENGAVSASPVQEEYLMDTELTLSATPDRDYKFSHWSGDISGSDNPIQLVMDADKNIVANFVELPLYTLRVNIENGTVVYITEGNTFREGSVVQIAVDPDDGFLFSEWTGDVEASTALITFTMDADKEITAVIVPEIKTYSIITEAVNGTITLDPAGGSYDENTEVTLTAVADENYQFESWSGSLSGEENPLVIKVIQDMDIVANFTTGSNITDYLYASETSLGQNYPNPFSLTTTIPYQLAKSTHVKLTVFNILGEKVLVLVDEYQAPGSYSVLCDMADFGTKNALGGIFLYQLKTNNNHSLVKKFALGL